MKARYGLFPGHPACARLHTVNDPQALFPDMQVFTDVLVSLLGMTTFSGRWMRGSVLLPGRAPKGSSVNTPPSVKCCPIYFTKSEPLPGDAVVAWQAHRSGLYIPAAYALLLVATNLLPIITLLTNTRDYVALRTRTMALMVVFGW
jgi:hypothetical protein